MKNRFFCIYFVLFAILLLAPFSLVRADSSMSLGQRILPVRFVYLDKQGQIKHIWSNVKSQDGLYVVKFFSNKQEVEPDYWLLENFQQEVITQANAFEQKSLEQNNIKFKEHLAVSFEKNTSILEEVHTYL